MRNISARERYGVGLCLSLLVWFWTADVAPLFAQDSSSQCIDEAIRDELNARRKYRGVQKRLFQKAGRHELSAIGGIYAADLLSSSYVVGGAYTFHFTED